MGGDDVPFQLAGKDKPVEAASKRAATRPGKRGTVNRFIKLDKRHPQGVPNRENEGFLYRFLHFTG
jgi:hypothetical protein